MTPEQIRQKRAAEVMESPLGAAIYEAVIWARKQVPMTIGDEIWLNPKDVGASVLIGGNLMGYPVCASSQVPKGEALVFCRSWGVYVRSGEEPQRSDLREALREAVGGE
jgi:hypothetical protein